MDDHGMNENVDDYGRKLKRMLNENGDDDGEEVEANEEY